MSSPILQNTDQILDSIVGSHILIVANDSPLVFQRLSLEYSNEKPYLSSSIDGKSTFEYINSRLFQ